MKLKNFCGSPEHAVSRRGFLTSLAAMAGTAASRRPAMMDFRKVRLLNIVVTPLLLGITSNQVGWVERSETQQCYNHACDALPR